MRGKDPCNGTAWRWPSPLKPQNRKNFKTMTTKNVSRLALSLTALSAIIAFSTGCNEGGAQQRPPPPAVTVAPVEQKEIVEWDEFTGHTEAVERVEVRPRV